MESCCSNFSKEMEWGLWLLGIHTNLFFGLYRSYSVVKSVMCIVRSDVYEGTRDAKVDDLAGIRHIIKPLEESGILVRRTDEEVKPLPIFITSQSVVNDLIFECSYCELWNRSWLLKEKVKSSLAQLCFPSLKTNAEKLQPLPLHQIAAVKAKAINC